MAGGCVDTIHCPCPVNLSLILVWTIKKTLEHFNTRGLVLIADFDSTERFYWGETSLPYRSHNNTPT